MSILYETIKELQGKIKEVHRKAYFISLEIHRKLRLARALSNDIESEKKKAKIEESIVEQLMHQVYIE